MSPLDTFSVFDLSVLFVVPGQSVNTESDDYAGVLLWTVPRVNLCSYTQVLLSKKFY